MFELNLFAFLLDYSFEKVAAWLRELINKHSMKGKRESRTKNFKLTQVMTCGNFLYISVAEISENDSIKSIEDS